MSKYEALDAAILKTIRDKNGTPIYEKRCYHEATVIADETGREAFRVIDARLQALRKAGKIAYSAKAHANGAGGWHVVTA